MKNIIYCKTFSPLKSLFFKKILTNDEQCQILWEDFTNDFDAFDVEIDVQMEAEEK